MENVHSIEYVNFTDAHVWGARIILMKLLSESKKDWNSFGFKLWAERQIRELEEVEDRLYSGDAA